VLVPLTDAQRVAILFGSKVPMLGVFALSGASDPAAVAAPDPALAPIDAIDEWLDAIGRVRPSVGQLTHVGLLADLLGGAGLDLCAGQHPRVAGEGWVATTMPTDTGSRLSVTYVTGGTSPAIGEPVCVLVIDRWVEQIPATEQTTAVAFHFDAPTNQAPQACLLAVLPAGRQWSIDTVHDTLLETLDWVRIRSVAPENLDIAGRAIPSTFIPGALKSWPADLAAEAQRELVS
jgi:hypothetical protein